MTFKQILVKSIYSLIMLKGKLSSPDEKGENNTQLINPPVSFYGLSATKNTGSELNFAELKGKKVLLVNTASNCGLTPQYNELQKLYEQHAQKLVIVGFPANDFKEQEKGSDEEIAAFCKINYGVTFPLMKKSSVIKGQNQNSIFNWLSDPGQNGWNDKEPTWNFTKYLVDENGVLTNYFSPQVSPLDNAVISKL